MDISIEKIGKFSDKRGNLVVFLKNTELDKKNREFGQIYFVTFEEKGIIRGNHYHNTFKEWFGIVSGKLKVILKDVDTNEVKEFVLDAKSDRYKRLKIGPRVAHAFVSLSKYSSLLNYTDKLYNVDDVHAIKLL